MGSSGLLHEDVTLYSPQGWRKDGTRLRLHIPTRDMESTWNTIYNHMWLRHKVYIHDLEGHRRHIRNQIHNVFTLSSTNQQTNGKNKPKFQCYICKYCNHDQDNWEGLLPVAEYAYNNSLDSTVKMSPFMANYGGLSRTNRPTAKALQNRTSQNHIRRMTGVHQLCHQQLEKASKTMRKYDDKTAKPAPLYRPGNLVMLNGKNFKSRRPARKMDAKLCGPFKVMKVMPPTARKLELHLWWRIHNVFHLS